MELTTEQRAELIAAGWTPPPAPEPDWGACVEAWDKTQHAYHYAVTPPLGSVDSAKKAAIRVIIKQADFWAEQKRITEGAKP